MSHQSVNNLKAQVLILPKKTHKWKNYLRQLINLCKDRVHMGKQGNYLFNDKGDFLVLKWVPFLQELYTFMKTFSLQFWELLDADGKLQYEFIGCSSVFIGKNVMFLQELLELLHWKRCCWLWFVCVCKKSLRIECVNPVYLGHLNVIRDNATVCVRVSPATYKSFVLKWILWFSKNLFVLIDDLKSRYFFSTVR